MSAKPVAALDDVLTPQEQDRLAADEAIIEAGIIVFFKVGMALARIRDQRTYRQGYATFEEYCDKRWHMSRTHAYRLIESAQVAEALSPIGDIPEIENEGQARALAPVIKFHGPKAGAKVLQEIKAEGKKVTAKAITEKVKPKVEKPKVEKPKAKRKPQPLPPSTEVMTRRIDLIVQATEPLPGGVINVDDLDVQMVGEWLDALGRAQRSITELQDTLARLQIVDVAESTVGGAA